MPKLRVPDKALDSALKDFGAFAILAIAASAKWLPLPMKAKAAQAPSRHG